jgi:hypothetical protein
MEKSQKRILYVHCLWWAFGSHLLNIKWAMIHAIKNNYLFFYRDNNNQVFVNDRITTYFEDLSDIDENYLITNDIFYGDCVIYDKIITMEELIPERFSYKPESFNSIKEFHQHLMKKIYRPNDFVKDNINNNNLIKHLRDNKIQYIGMHIRLSDKVSGPNKETEYIDLKNYLDECIKIRNNCGINNIVICSDTDYGIEFIKAENDKLENRFNIYYNNEHRADNNWKCSATHIINNSFVDKDILVQEYLICFINFQLLLEANILVGNFDSGFILSAVEYRNNGIDINVNKVNPPMYGIDGLEKKWLDNFII